MHQREARKRPMGMMETKNVIIYLISKLGNRIEGRKKLMKLMFLVEHFDTKNEKVTKNHTLGNQFFIYYYGVFSFDVMKSFTELDREKKIEDTYLIPLKTKHEVELDEKLREKVDWIVEKFGDLSGYRLETETLRMLKIEPSEKDSYFGKKVEEII